MRKASRILFLVGAIVAIVAAVGYLIAGLLLVILPNVPEIIEAVRESADPSVTDEQLEAARVALTINGVFCLLGVPVCGVNSFFAFKAHFAEKPSKALNVLNIVFGALSVEINLVGAIFALIANGQEDRRAALEQKE